MSRRLRALVAGIEQFDGVLLTAVLCLCVLGTVMVYNAGSFRSSSSTYYLVQHLVRLGLGLGVLWFLAGLDYQALRRGWLNGGLLALGLGLVLMTVVLRHTGLVASRAQASRWINIPFMPVQPVEILKVALVLFLAQQCAGGWSRLRRDRERTALVLGVPIAAVVVLALQPNFGNAIVMILLTLTLLVLSGLPLRALALMGGSSVVAAVLGYLIVPRIHYRLSLWWQCLATTKWSHLTEGSLYQVYQSLLGIGAGGWHGTGLGASHQRFAFLPDPHTDFIFSVVGEELGLVGALCTLFLFVLIGWRGYNIARRAGDEFGSLVAAGLTTMLMVYAAVNVGMVTAVLPVMGLPLPFVSYGGSALITNLAAVGILLSIDRHGRSLRAVDVRVIGRN